jgi:hypothetical protein
MPYLGLMLTVAEKFNLGVNPLPKSFADASKERPGSGISRQANKSDR